MTHFLGCSLRMIILLVILIFFPFETPATNIMGGEDNRNPVIMSRGQEELVSWAGYGEEKLSVVSITGKVVCGDACEDGRGTAQLPSRPVSGATVAVFCGTKKSRKSWVRTTTDETGDFSVEVPSHLHATPNLDKACFVNLLHLPKHSLCSRQKITRKQMIKGIGLLSTQDGARVYVADTMFLKPRSSKACKFTQLFNKTSI